MEPAFYEPTGTDGETEHFTATDHTRGPWNPDHQHGGPPAALLGRALERCVGIPDALVGRITLEILGPVPIGSVSTAARITRPGRRVEMIEGELCGADGRALLRARAWRVARAELDLPADMPVTVTEPPPGPDVSEASAGLGGQEGAGWLSAMEIRFARGSFSAEGAAMAWLRMRGPLVVGEEPSPLTRVLIAADGGNGISHVLSFEQWIFINTDLTVSLHRHPRGEWIGLDARSEIEPTGLGMAQSSLYDESGPLGTGLQTLLVAQR